MTLQNLLANIPSRLDNEQFEPIAHKGSVTIERILSRGHSSPAAGWYDAKEDEWVLLVEGEAILEFADGHQHRLQRGDHLLIPAHCRHRVAWTPADRTTIWLAVHF